MRKIRIGNDIAVQWSLVAKGTGEPFVVEGKDIRLTLKNIFAKTTINEFDVAGNTISWTFKGAEQKQVGIYSLEVSLLDEQGIMITTDVCDFVELVACSCEIGGVDATGVHTESIELVSDVDVAAGIDLSKYLTKTEAQTTYQPQEKGKGLSTNDYTTAEKNKLAGLQNYDDTEIRQELTELSAEKEDKTNKVTSLTEESTDEQYPSAKAVYALKERIEDNELMIDDLFDTKIDKEADDYYPQLSVGLADNLSGVDVVASEVNFRRSGGGAISDGVARIEAIKGNSVVWNQKLNNAYQASGIGGWYVRQGQDKAEFLDNSVTWSFVSGVSSIPELAQFAGFTKGRKYLFVTEYKLNWVDGGKEFYLILRQAAGPANSNVVSLGATIGTRANQGTVSLFFESQYDDKPYLSLLPYNITNDIGGSATLTKARVIDLTQMFGAGNEPTTIEEFYARIPMGVDLNAYNEGEVIHMDVQSIESVGVNQWDEEWELGKLATSTGTLQESAKYIRTKNFIPILPNTDYYKHSPKTSFYWHCYYDKEKNFIGSSGHGMNAVFRTPSNAFYMKTFSEESYGVTYNHDICINISDTSINGKYFPYIKRTEDLSIIRKYFPDGMKSAGTAHDEIRYNKVTQKWEMVQRIGEVKMRDLNWVYNTSTIFSATVSDMYIAKNKDERKDGILSAKYGISESSNINTEMSDKSLLRASQIYLRDTSYSDSASLKASFTDDDILYYELAEPIVTELDAEDQFRDLDYQVWNCGTEKAIAEGKSAPLAADITYGFNAIGKIKELESLVAALRAKVGI